MGNDERGRFLGIFEQICQTMAYAHSRGVIHRDLKPANVMVGAFGEVQVMDWGLAKVLSSGEITDEKKARQKQQDQSVIRTLRSRVGSDVPGQFEVAESQTQMGSVMGTPAYMPPEQALGEIDHLDERTDVFGLGAILCEILTGNPPYAGDDGTQVYRMASRGKLADCFARLDACGADAELIKLNRHCLELEPVDRPRNACVLAKQITAYLESVETRLRETELERAAEAARAEEALHTAREQKAAARAERRARKLQLSLAAGVVCVLAVGGIAAALTAAYQSQLKNAALQSEERANQAAKAETRQRQLAEAARTKAEQERARAESERLRADETLADMQTARGFQAAREGDAATAALWFAQAAQSAHHDPTREQANRLRAKNWLGEAIRPAAILKTPPGRFRTMLFQPDGGLALTINPNQLRLWDWRYEQILSWSERRNDVVIANWSPNGKLLAVGTASGKVQLLDPVNGAIRQQFSAEDSIGVLEWSPTGNQLAIAGRKLQVWDVTKEPRKLSEWLHPDIVYGVSFNRAGTQVATACRDKKARIFTTGDSGNSPPVVSAVDHVPYPDYMIPPQFCDEDRRLVTIGASGHPAWWDVATAERLSPVETNPIRFERVLAASRDGRWIAAAGFQSCRLWSLDGARSFELPHANYVESTVFLPDGQSRLTTCWDGTARLCSLSDPSCPQKTVPQMATQAVCRLASDGEVFAICDSEKCVLWEMPRQNAILGEIAGWPDPNCAPRISQDGRLATPGARHESPTPLRAGSRTFSVALTSMGGPAGPPISQRPEYFTSRHGGHGGCTRRVA